MNSQVPIIVELKTIETGLYITNICFATGDVTQVLFCPPVLGWLEYEKETWLLRNQITSLESTQTWHSLCTHTCVDELTALSSFLGKKKDVESSWILYKLCSFLEVNRLLL